MPERVNQTLPDDFTLHDNLFFKVNRNQKLTQGFFVFFLSHQITSERHFYLFNKVKTKYLEERSAYGEPNNRSPHDPERRNAVYSSTSMSPGLKYL